MLKQQQLSNQLQGWWWMRWRWWLLRCHIWRLLQQLTWPNYELMRVVVVMRLVLVLLPTSGRPACCRHRPQPLHTYCHPAVEGRQCWSGHKTFSCSETQISSESNHSWVRSWLSALNKVLLYVHLILRATSHDVSVEFQFLPSDQKMPCQHVSRVTLTHMITDVKRGREKKDTRMKLLDFLTM